MRRTATIAGLVLVMSALAPPGAAADGLPVGGVDAGPTGIAVPGSPGRFVTLPAGADTVVARIDPDGGQVLGSRLLRGTFTIPAVALDGSASGLSADGRTLVLIRPRAAFPRARTAFAVLGGRWLGLRRRVLLDGDFSFDALSPDGRTMFLIEYTSPRDPARYAVRAYDLRSGRLLPGAIVDRREPDERMHGLPITRTSSPDGRWAYTLYDGAGSHPFVHALDAAQGEAFCIDLDGLHGRRDLYRLRLALAGDGSALLVRDGGRSLLAIDRATFEVATPWTLAARSAVRWLLAPSAV